MDVVFGRDQDRSEFAAETDISVRSRQWTSTPIFNKHLSKKAIQEVRIYQIKTVSLLGSQSCTTSHECSKVD